MNPNKPRASAAIFEVLKGKVIFCLRYWPFYVIVVTLLVFVACYSPSQRMVDNYSQLSDQHSPVQALKSYPLIALCSLLPWFQATAVKLVFLLFYHLWILLVGVGCLFLVRALDSSSTRYRWIVFILPMTMLNSYTAFTVIRTDLALYANLLFLLGLSTYLISKRIKSVWIFIGSILLILNALSYRSNALVLLPFLVCYMTPLLPKFVKMGRWRQIFLSVLLIIVVFLIQSVLPVDREYPIRVLMKSDILCTQLLAKENTEDQSKEEGVLFPLYWYGWNNDGKTKEEQFSDLCSQWKETINNHPREFVATRSINYLQFLFIGMLPESICNIIRKHYPDVKLPEPHMFIYHKLCGNMLVHEHYSDKSFNWKYFNWVPVSRVVFIINVFSVLTASFFILVMRHPPREIELRFVKSTSLMAVAYLLSFLVATPSPDIRFHLTSVMFGIFNMAILIIFGFNSHRRHKHV